jgi:hypothetical protein
MAILNFFLGIGEFNAIKDQRLLAGKLEQIKVLSELKNTFELKKLTSLHDVWRALHRYGTPIRKTALLRKAFAMLRRKSEARRLSLLRSAALHCHSLGA